MNGNTNTGVIEFHQQTQELEEQLPSILRSHDRPIRLGFPLTFYLSSKENNFIKAAHYMYDQIKSSSLCKNLYAGPYTDSSSISSYIPLSEELSSWQPKYKLRQFDDSFSSTRVPGLSGHSDLPSDVYKKETCRIRLFDMPRNSGVVAFVKSSRIHSLHDWVTQVNKMTMGIMALESHEAIKMAISTNTVKAESLKKSFEKVERSYSDIKQDCINNLVQDPFNGAYTEALCHWMGNYFVELGHVKCFPLFHWAGLLSQGPGFLKELEHGNAKDILNDDIFLNKQKLLAPELKIVLQMPKSSLYNCWRKDEQLSSRKVLADLFQIVYDLNQMQRFNKFIKNNMSMHTIHVMDNFNTKDEHFEYNWNDKKYNQPNNGRFCVFMDNEEATFVFRGIRLLPKQTSNHAIQDKGTSEGSLLNPLNTISTGYGQNGKVTVRDEMAAEIPTGKDLKMLALSCTSFLREKLANESDDNRDKKTLFAMLKRWSSVAPGSPLDLLGLDLQYGDSNGDASEFETKKKSYQTRPVSKHVNSSIPAHQQGFFDTFLV